MPQNIVSDQVLQFCLQSVLKNNETINFNPIKPLNRNGFAQLIREGNLLGIHGLMNANTVHSYCDIA